MASFAVLSGAKLKNAIDKFATTASTFSETTHQLAYSALVHIDEHSCASHLNRLFAATPANYRGALRVWATHFGKVKFDSEAADASAPFSYLKGAASDLPAALLTSPADFQKEKAASTKADKPFDEIAAFEKLLARLEDKGASARATELAKAAIRALKTPVEAAAAPAKPGRKSKTTPALVVSNPAPVAPAPVEALPAGAVAGPIVAVPAAA